MLLYSKILLNALESAGKTTKIRFSEDTLKEVITKTLGKPTSSDEIRYFKSTRRTRALAPCIFGHLRPKVKLVASALQVSELPKSTLPEVFYSQQIVKTWSLQIAFYGRSNVGKSMLINAVLGKLGLCDVKDLPGTTRKLFFYQICSPGRVMLVDMPGYGYSVCSEDVSILCNEFSLWYIKNRENLKLLVLLIDGRVGLKRSDFEVINFCDKYKVRWLPVLSKCDAVKPVLLAKMLQKVRFDTQQFRFMLTHAIPVSGTKMQNLDELRNVLADFKLVSKATQNDGQDGHSLLHSSLRSKDLRSSISSKGAPPKGRQSTPKLLFNYLPEEQRASLRNEWRGDQNGMSSMNEHYGMVSMDAHNVSGGPLDAHYGDQGFSLKDAHYGDQGFSLKDVILGSLDEIYAKMGMNGCIANEWHEWHTTKGSMQSTRECPDELRISDRVNGPLDAHNDHYAHYGHPVEPSTHPVEPGGYTINSKGYIEIANYKSLHNGHHYAHYDGHHSILTPIVDIQHSTLEGRDKFHLIHSGDIQFELSVDVGDTLQYVDAEDQKAVQTPNLVADKIASFERRLSSGLLKFSKIERPKFKRSYKRVFSMFKPKNVKRYMYIEKTSGKVGTWSRIYDKWAKWSRRHPDLASTVEPPTKSSIEGAASKRHIRKVQLGTHAKREKLRNAVPKV